MSSQQSYGVEGEREFLNLVDVKEGWKLVERFSTLVRESGSHDELVAAEYIVDRLKSFAIPVEILEPQLYLSVPRSATVQIHSGDGSFSVRAKTPSFSLSTEGKGVTAQVVYIPATPVQDTAAFFGRGFKAPEQDVKGKIVLTDGRSVPIAVRQFQERGAIGQIYINPGQNIHEGICTPIWGAPTLSSVHQKPSSPVATINRPDGERIAALCRNGTIRATMTTQLDEGWKKCPLPVATIPGKGEEELFLLAHGHLCSWHVGATDNATGDGTLLELARIFFQGRQHLRRTLKIAWWPGHSQGRYAGSTWYADNFAAELRRNCIGQVNIDSPGCRGATAFEEVSWMVECDELCRKAILDSTGKESKRARPLRAGDYSFNQIGLTGFFMLLSNIPEAERKRLGYYPVGGSGGNIAWHTEDDRIENADPEIMRQDLKVYVTALTRVLNATVLPYDFTKTTQEIRQALEEYQKQAGDGLALGQVFRQLDALDGELRSFYRRASQPKQDEAREINRVLMEVGRKLVPLNYTYVENFDQDSAEPQVVVPKLKDISLLKSLDKDPVRKGFLITELVRQSNKVVNVLFETTQLLRQARGAVNA